MHAFDNEEETDEIDHQLDRSSGCDVGHERRGGAGHQGRCHAVGDRSGGIAGHSGAQYVSLLPQTIGGKKINYIVLDDASDTTTAVRNARKLISEDKVDVLVGSTVTPNSLAMIDVAAEGETPMISMAASSRIVEPVDAKRRWVFKTPQNDQQMALVIIGHMLAQGVKTVGFIGFADAYGEGWWTQFSTLGEARGLKIVGNERYQRADTSVTGQVLKLVSAKPDAILIAGSGTPAALPQKTLKERGYAGKIYQTHGVANNDFLRVCGKDCEGTFLPAGPVLVTEQLPNDHPVKKSATAYVTAYEGAQKGSVSTFGAHAWDVGVLLQQAIPVALKKVSPAPRSSACAARCARRREERCRRARHLQYERQRSSGS